MMINSLGYQLIDWMEFHLCHGPGDLQGQPLRLDVDVKRFIVRAYELNDDGRRVYREAFYSRAKGCAKSETAGALVCAEFIGPVRFDHYAEPGEVSPWGYVYTPGEPVGRPVQSPFIRCLATEEDQTGNTYDNVTTMLTYLVEHYGEHFPAIDLGRSIQTSTRVFLEGGGEIRPSSSGAASKDGGKETFAVADETHLYNETRLRKMFDTVQRNTGKRKIAEPWLLQTSTMYAPGEESVAEKTHLAHEAGTLKGVLFDHVQGPEVKSLRHTNKLREALRVAYVDRPWIDYDRLVELAQDERTEKSDVLRYWLNRPTPSEGQWIDPESIDRVILPGNTIPPKGTQISLGFDGALTDDHAALVGCVVETGHLFIVDHWRPEDYDGEIDPALVDDAVRWAFGHYDVVLFYADPARWQSWLATWARDLGGRKQRVREYWTHRETEMARSTLELKEAILTGQVTLAASKAMRTHFLNARKRQVPAGTLIRKEHSKSKKKIDIAVCCILAYAARNKAVGAGLVRRKGKVRVYT